MGLARVCDRCKKYYKDYYTGLVNSYNALIGIDKPLNGGYHERRSLDLCPDCKRDFERWLNDYTEPTNASVLKRDEKVEEENESI